MKRNIIVIVLIVVASIASIIGMKNSTHITFNQYKLGTNEILKTEKVTSIDDIYKIRVYVKELKPLKGNDALNLMLANQIEIKYNKDISIGIQLGQSKYCYYINKSKNISSLSKMPKGLYSWVTNKVKNTKN